MVGTLKRERDLIEIRMEELVDNFKSTFRPPWKSHLAIQRVARGGVYVRWRAPGVNGNGQAYFDLFGSERGDAILRQQSREVLLIFCDFESQRIQLNMAHSVLTGIWIRLHQHISAIENMAIYQAQPA